MSENVITGGPRALAYLRVSSKGQVDGDGFDRQEDAVYQWADAHGAALLGVFREEGVSGTKELLHRPALNRLIARVAEGGIDTVLIEKADRLARDLIVSELLLRQFAELGVRVIEAEGGNDLTAGSDNPTATLIRQILAAVAQFEKSSVVAKLRVARNRRRASTGRCEGVKPYGAKKGEREIVEMMLAWREGGLTSRGIAQELNRRMLWSRSGKPWNHTVVARVLSREGAGV